MEMKQCCKRRNKNANKKKRRGGSIFLRRRGRYDSYLDIMSMNNKYIYIGSSNKLPFHITCITE